MLLIETKFWVMHFYRWTYSLKDCITCLNSYSASHHESSEAYSDDEKRAGTIKKECGTWIQCDWQRIFLLIPKLMSECRKE